MVNREEVFGNKPKRLVCDHPLKMIEALQVDGTREGAQRPLSAQIEINLKVAEGQFAERAVNRLSVAASGVIGLGHRSPMPVPAVDRNHVVGIVLRLEIENQRWIAIGAKGGGGKHGALKTVRGVLAQHDTGRPAGIGQVIRHVVEKALDTVWTFQTAQLAKLLGRKTAQRMHHRCRKFN